LPDDARRRDAELMRDVTVGHDMTWGDRVHELEDRRGPTRLLRQRSPA
jgi:hypothetical protein